MLADFLGIDLSLDTELAAAPAAEIEGSQLQQDLAHLMDQRMQADATTTSVKAASLVAIREKKMDEEAPAEQTVAASKVDPEAEDEALVADNIVQGDDTLTLSQIVQTWQPEMEEFQLGQTTVRASFDMSDTDAFALFSFIDTTTNQRTTNFRLFDDMAQQLIDYLKAKDGEFGVIELSNEIIMIDRTAVTGGEIEYMHWETSDGMIISLVGLASDFQQFDMIA